MFGDNGQGKTNFIESIYALCTLRSFRAKRLADLIAIGSEQAYMQAVLERGGLERTYEVTIKPRSRIVRLDGKAVRPIGRYFGDFNVVLFAPEDLAVPKGPPADRRRFLDRAVFNRERGFLATASAYEKALKSRNALLRGAKDGRAPSADVLGVYSEAVALHGARLLVARRDYIAALGPMFTSAFNAISQQGLEGQIAYKLSTALRLEGTEDELRSDLRAAIDESRSRDLARGSTSVGPHRDDLSFTLAGQAAATFASQGQLRALVLAWKTAEMTLLQSSHENAPILLLDDVSSELDDVRNRTLFEFLRERQNQCFITTTAARHVLLEDDRRNFRVHGGRIEPV